MQITFKWFVLIFAVATTAVDKRPGMDNNYRTQNKQQTYYPALSVIVDNSTKLSIALVTYSTLINRLPTKINSPFIRVLLANKKRNEQKTIQQAKNCKCIVKNVNCDVLLKSFYTVTEFFRHPQRVDTGTYTQGHTHTHEYSKEVKKMHLHPTNGNICKQI